MGRVGESTRDASLIVVILAAFSLNGELLQFLQSNGGDNSISPGLNLLLCHVGGFCFFPYLWLKRGEAGELKVELEGGWKKNVLRCCLMSGLLMACAYCWVISATKIAASLTNGISQTSIAMVAVLAPLVLGERTSTLKLAGVALAVVGTVLASVPAPPLLSEEAVSAGESSLPSTDSWGAGDSGSEQAAPVLLSMRGSGGLDGDLLRGLNSSSASSATDLVSSNSTEGGDAEGDGRVRRVEGVLFGLMSAFLNAVYQVMYKKFWPKASVDFMILYSFLVAAVHVALVLPVLVSAHAFYWERFQFPSSPLLQGAVVISALLAFTVNSLYIVLLSSRGPLAASAAYALSIPATVLLDVVLHGVSVPPAAVTGHTLIVVAFGIIAGSPLSKPGTASPSFLEDDQPNKKKRRDSQATEEVERRPLVARGGNTGEGDAGASRGSPPLWAGGGAPGSQESSAAPVRLGRSLETDSEGQTELLEVAAAPRDGRRRTLSKQRLPSGAASSPSDRGSLMSASKEEDGNLLQHSNQMTGTATERKCFASSACPTSSVGSREEQSSPSGLSCPEELLSGRHAASTSGGAPNRLSPGRERNET
uniref:EamA domain-containing protein n=1 Tax=Chromera velia CCMP2878 TaxID=1169474 RepID=A0A0G4HTF1_9ALVE|eukprot:Cvel_8443.t1-p1 / transcript=Cvel_8443.t1 / gene=Cvel_8443 / organism=Chromera_velia_CCMP2878 / gene_product=hypothetical protein / transcript_product=hypothetical protein / location=Cvel_scaffold466:30541-37175(-) / protein_length=591 / sequence_SO=supercontig / SO=protein_coding / is_pseudo=false